MAFSDVRIAGAGDKLQTFEQNIRQRPKLNNFTNAGARENVRKGAETDLKPTVDHAWLGNDLEFQKVMQEAQEQEGQEFVATDEPFISPDKPDKYQDDLFEAVHHPLDLSFTRDKNLGKKEKGYASDNDQKGIQKNKELPSEYPQDSSILSSDDPSLEEKINMKPCTSAVKLNRKQRAETNMQKSRDVLSKIKRNGTADFDKKPGMNDSQSTEIAWVSNINKQMDVLSNLTQTAKREDLKLKKRLGHASTAKGKSEKTDVGAQTSQNTAEAPKATATATPGQQPSPENNNGPVGKPILDRNKREKLKIYSEIDKIFFTNERPSNPLDFINKDTQKVMINPGIPYVSTSHYEIFERRNISAAARLNRNNHFIAAPVDEQEDPDIYMGRPEDSYITTNFEAYQLKNLMEHQKLDEIEWDSDDEDTLILAPQPYETVMQTGFKDYLNHLSTKFIARRSDIIVSSTLSMTLTPLADEFKPTQFSFISDREIWNYVLLRQQYRSFSIRSNRLTSLNPPENDSDNSSFDGNKLHNQQNDDADSLGSFFDENQDPYSAHSVNDNSPEAKLGDMHHNRHQMASFLQQKVSLLPATLLSKPLDQKQVMRLGKKEKRMYTMQKSKWEQVIKTFDKKTIHPSS